MSRAIIIPNVHGCFHELTQLWKACEVKRTDAVYMLGNVINGGPEPYHTMNFLLHQCKNVQFVKGEFEYLVEHQGYMCGEVQALQCAFPSLEIALFHLDMLRNAPEYVQLPMVYLTRYQMPNLRKEKLDIPLVLSDGNALYKYAKPFIFTDWLGEICVGMPDTILHGGSLHAIVIENEEQNVYNWKYTSVPAIKKYAN